MSLESRVLLTGSGPRRLFRASGSTDSYNPNRMFLPSRHAHEDSYSRKAWIVLLLTVCGTMFFTRGPFRAARGSDLNDLISPYIQATALVHGADPYSAQSLLEFWPVDALASRPDPQEFGDDSILTRHGIPTAYPLTSFLLLAPFTFLPWHVFKALAIFVNVALFFFAVWSLMTVTEMNRTRRLFFAAAALLFAPVHTGIATYNLAIVATELGIISLLAEHRRREIESGLLIVLSTALKPQIGLCFLIYYIVRRHNPVFVLGSLATLVALPMARLAFAHVNWLSNYTFDNHALLTIGVLGDFTDRNPLRFGLVNLQVGMYPFLHNRHAANVSALVFSLVLFAVWMVLVSRLRRRNNLLCLGALAAISLLPFYHRFYDATLLLIPLCCLLARPKLNRCCVIGLLALSAFMVPGGSMLETLRNRGLINSSLSSMDWWNGLVMAHAVWCLVVLTLVLLYDISTEARNGAELQQPTKYPTPKIEMHASAS